MSFPALEALERVPELARGTRQKRGSLWEVEDLGAPKWDAEFGGTLTVEVEDADWVDEEVREALEQDALAAATRTTLL